MEPVEGIVERIKTAATAEFAGSDPQVEWDEDLQKVVGVILWDGFGRMHHARRQTKLWTVLKKTLGKDAQWVSLILAYTPDEYNVMMAA